VKANDLDRSEGQKSRVNLEDKLDVLLLQIDAVQDVIWDDLENLRVKGKLSIELEEFARTVMTEVSAWMDQCTTTTESQPILFRRMEVQLERLSRVQELIETASMTEKAENIEE
jgi:hypothetical protein